MSIVSTEYVQKLRTAAGLLRERASKAPGGPWWADQSPDDGLIVAFAEHPGDRQTGGSCLAFFAYPDDADRRTYEGALNTATYVAMMSPVVAFPLAAWLEFAAMDAERRGVDGEFAALVLAEALQVNGRTGEQW